MWRDTQWKIPHGKEPMPPDDNSKELKPANSHMKELRIRSTMAMPVDGGSPDQLHDDSIKKVPELEVLINPG